MVSYYHRLDLLTRKGDFNKNFSGPPCLWAQGQGPERCDVLFHVRGPAQTRRKSSLLQLPSLWSVTTGDILFFEELGYDRYLVSLGRQGDGDGLG